MKIFNARAFSAAARQLRAASSASTYANDLVNRTLAIHGLNSGLKAAAPGSMPEATRPKTRAPRPEAKTARSRSTTTFPAGATFAEDEFCCSEGKRRFLTYVPASATNGLQGLVVMLHGCTQTPEDFAAGTRMNELAEEHRFVVVYPHQSRGENAQSCWNWFRRGDQRRERGEPAILSGLAQSVASQHHIAKDKVFIAGLSAGGAMAAILGETYPDVFAAIGVHSGLPVESAKDVPSAFAAMAGKPMQRVSTKKTSAARTIVLHGLSDGIVHPGNGHEIVRQALDQGPDQTIQIEERSNTNGRRYARNITSDAAGAALVEHWEIEGLGHAWSGGSRAGTYTDPTGPDASAEMIRFFLGEDHQR
jgi:poly(hydroxyalkanoate) depolymerase family esterase